MNHTGSPEKLNLFRPSCQGSDAAELRFSQRRDAGRERVMFEFTESIQIEAPPDHVWELLTDVECWWPPSNPEHIGIEVRSADKSIGVGTEIVFEERVAGIRCRAQGSVTRLIPGIEVAWEGMAKYRYMGFEFRIREGVSWRVDGDGEPSQLSAHVWAEFPSSILGRLLEWYARSFLNVVDRDREHARRELEYLKSAVEDAD
jgi:hypothetical protein